ncbi:MAG TPA: ComEC/Rec2 family competence protein, partial [bacterium]|nr:ComEC/Rec2 family competence protein [bacterium]
LVRGAVFLATGIFLGRLGRLPELPAGIGALAALGLGLALPRGRGRGAALAAAAFLAGAWRLAGTGHVPADDVSTLTGPGTVAVVGTIVDEPVRERHSVRFLLACETADGGGRRSRIGGRLAVTFHGAVADLAPALQYGNTVEVRSRIRIPRESVDIDGFSRKTFLAARGIYAESTVYRTDAVRLLRTGGGSRAKAAAISLRRRLEAVIDSSLPDREGQPGGIEAALLKAVLLGRRDALPARIRENFRGTGIIHVLVVSGLHIGFIWLLADAVFTFLPLRARHLILIPLVAGYVYLTGARPPAVRAGLMAAIYSAGIVLNQPAQPWTALAAAGSALLLWNPLNLFLPGFQFSFLLVATILLLYPRLRKALAFLPAWAAAPAAATLAAQAGAVPLTAHYFRRFYPAGLIANLLIVPLVGAIVALGFAAAWAGLAWTKAAVVLNYPNRTLISWLLRLAGLGSRLPGADIAVPCFPGSWAAAWFLLLLAWAGPGRWKLRTAAVMLLAAACVAAGLFRPRERCRLTFFDGESGEFVLGEGPRGAFLLGPDDDAHDEIGMLVEPELFRRGIAELDWVVLAGAGPDHLGTLTRLLERVAVKRVLEPPGLETTAAYPAFLRLLEREEIELVRAEAGVKFYPGGLEATICWPPPGTLPEDGDRQRLGAVFGEGSRRGPADRRR